MALIIIILIISLLIIIFIFLRNVSLPLPEFDIPEDWKV